MAGERHRHRSEFDGSEELALVAAEAERLGVPFAVGVTEDVADQPGGSPTPQIVVSPDGDVTSRYDKVRRVPFGEYVPLRGLLEALGAPLDQVPTDAVAGTGPAVLDLPDGTRLGVVISWEVFFGGRAREGVKAGGEVILNPTNGASYTGTIVQTQQVASSRLRAIETGRWVVQVSPTGFSAFVTPDGDVLQRTAVSEQAVIRQEIAAADAAHVVRQPRRLAVDRSPCVLVAGGVVAARRCADDRRRAITVTGPSLTSATCIVGAEAAGGDRRRRGGAARPTTASTSGSACSGRAAAIQLGRRPGRGVAVERELADDEHLAAGVGDRAVHHAVVVVEDPQVPRACRPVRRATSASSSWVTPTSTHSPGPIAPTSSPSTVTAASRTRCTTARTPHRRRHRPLASA